MNAAGVNIREINDADAEAIAAIYAHHVIHGTASYDTEPPSVDAMRGKIAQILAAGWPYLVAEAEGDVVGYAYATQFRDRAAYAWTAEDSIYVHPDFAGQGIGRALLEKLCIAAEQFGFRQIVAVIGGAEEASVRLHAACGFRETGRLQAAGWKKGRWLDNVYMQLALGEGSATSPNSLNSG